MKLKSTFSIPFRRGLPAEAVFAAGLLLSGFAAMHRSALRRTEVFYRAETLEKLPEKASGTPVRVLNVRPSGSRILGTFEFTTDRSAEFALESAQHNARKCGADAVWVRQLRQWAEPYTQYIPAHTSFVPSTQWISGPVWRPGPPGGMGRVQRGGVWVQSFGISHSPPPDYQRVGALHPHQRGPGAVADIGLQRAGRFSIESGRVQAVCSRPTGRFHPKRGS